MLSSFAVALLCSALAEAACAALPVTVPLTSSVSPSALSAFVSLSIELSSFPEFAGTTSSPNEFSVNLLTNLGSFQEYMPMIRVGGNTQDRAIYDANLTSATADSCSADPSAILCIGPSFFDSYRTFPNTFYSHGFNLAANNDSGYATLQATVPLACKAIGSQLNVWELGNEPDLYVGVERSSSWTTSDYVTEWLNGSSYINTYLQSACPDMAPPRFMAPSFSSPNGHLSVVTAFQDGQDSQNTIVQTSVHNYISGATSKGVTLQATLLNHNVTVASVSTHVSVAKSLASDDPAPYILGECNSLYGGGATGLSNVFGAALWALDFTLYAASTGWIHRLHFHQSSTAAYAAWTPKASGSTPPATHAPYYGHLASARFLGASNVTTVVPISVSSSAYESAYAAYVGGTLARLAVLNMVEFNGTSTTRPTVAFSFALDSSLSGSTWTVERLTAPGSNSTTGATFGGYAYEYATTGQAALVNGTAASETVTAGSSGVLSISVADSEAAILTLAK